MLKPSPEGEGTPNPRIRALDRLVALIEIEGVKGRNNLGSEYRWVEAEIPAGPYLMLDAADGSEQLDQDPALRTLKIISNGRLPYTVWRGIIHVILFPEVLRSHNLDLVASPGMPFLCLYYGEPRLESYRYMPYVFPGWGAPSCKSISV